MWMIASAWKGFTGAASVLGIWFLSRNRLTLR